MKKLFIFAITLLSLSAQARQYIQCANIDGDPFYTVINLVNNDHGTLFATSGVENDDERVLIKIQKTGEDEESIFLQTVEETGSAKIAIPKSVLNSNVNGFEIKLLFSGIQLNLDCFARMYED